MPSPRPQMPSSGNVIRWGKESARVGPWRADGSVAFFVPTPDGTPASPEFVHRCLRVLANQGFQRVITGALSPPEQVGLLDAGFEVYERLHLLLLDRSTALPPLPGQPRRHHAGRRRQKALLKVDGAAFSPFWTLTVPVCKSHEGDSRAPPPRRPRRSAHRHRLRHLRRLGTARVRSTPRRRSRRAGPWVR